VNNIAPINKGIPVLEVEGKNKTNFLSGIFLRWLKDVQALLRRSVVTDENGNIAYGGAVIPSDVDTTFIHIFYSNSMCRIISPNGHVLYDTRNAYVSSSGPWKYIEDGDAYLDRSFQSNTEVKSIYVANGLSGNDISWAKVYNQDSSGNVNIKTGSTYTATL